MSKQHENEKTTEKADEKTINKTIKKKDETKFSTVKKHSNVLRKKYKTKKKSFIFSWKSLTNGVFLSYLLLIFLCVIQPQLCYLVPRWPPQHS